jgi:transketolase
LFESYRTRHPELAGRYERERAGRLPEGWEEALPDLTTETGPLATRSASGKTLNALAGKIENLFGGSADLAPSNKTLLDGYPDFGSGRRGGRNIRFGVREHAMAAICNGLALSGGVRPYCGTFLIFSDYMRPAVRMAALMGLNVTYVFTHDSIGVGEDGPTHQPIEQLAALRVIPDLTVLRPADAVETAEAWRLALETDGPVCLALTRQKVPPLGVSAETARRGMNQGAYVVRDADHPQVVIVATGSEVHLAVEAHELLAQSGVPARVVSMPGREIFLRQPEDYQDRILPPTLDKRLIVEAGSATGWNRLAGPGGGTLTIDRFGQSAPGPEVMRRLGFTAENVAERAKALL